MKGDRALILASASQARLRMLQASGIAVRAWPSGLDEEPLKLAMRAADAQPGDLALALARAKAETVLAACPDGARALVIGADQVLTCGDEWHDRPVDLAAARRQLVALRGRSHRLTTAVVLCGGRGGTWHLVDDASLRMRAFSDQVLDRYLRTEGEAVLGTVGGYRVEGPGLQLFEAIAGDWFTILGLPLLPLLGRLRQEGVLEE